MLPVATPVFMQEIKPVITSKLIRPDWMPVVEDHEQDEQHATLKPGAAVAGAGVAMGAGSYAAAATTTQAAGAAATGSAAAATTQATGAITLKAASPALYPGIYRILADAAATSEATSGVAAGTAAGVAAGYVALGFVGGGLVWWACQSLYNRYFPSKPKPKVVGVHFHLQPKLILNGGSKGEADYIIESEKTVSFVTETSFQRAQSQEVQEAFKKQIGTKSKTGNQLKLSADLNKHAEFEWVKHCEEIFQSLIDEAVTLSCKAYSKDAAKESSRSVKKDRVYFSIKVNLEYPCYLYLGNLTLLFDNGEETRINSLTVIQLSQPLPMETSFTYDFTGAEL